MSSELVGHYFFLRYKLFIFTSLLIQYKFILKSNDVKKIRYTAERTLLVSVMIGHFIVGLVGNVRD